MKRERKRRSKWVWFSMYREIGNAFGGTEINTKKIMKENKKCRVGKRKKY